MKIDLPFCIMLFFIMPAIFPVFLKAQQNTCRDQSHYTPDKKYPEHTSLKYLKLNFHFMLKEDSTGNFRPYDDGLGDSSYNALVFSRKLIERANHKLAHNIPMNLPHGNNTPVLPLRYRYVLTGVFFHYHDRMYYMQKTSGSELLRTYGKNAGKEINVFFCGISDPGHALGGNANLSGPRWVRLQRAWTRHRNGHGPWLTAGLLNHEIGHNLHLHHTMHGMLGDCSYNQDDDCDDTPTRQEVLEKGFPDPCCWTGQNCSNNMMDYNASQQALTPCQLGIIHYTLINEMKNYLENDFCSYHESTIEINPYDTVTWKSAHYAEGDLIIRPGALLKVLCKVNMPPGGKIKIEKGGKLIVDSGLITNDCDWKWEGIETAGKGILSFFGFSSYQPVTVINGGKIEKALHLPDF